MRLYHTSQLIIKDPDVHFGRKNADFGQGFYLSPDKDFVHRWATKDAYVNEYELDTAGLIIVQFQRSKEWFEYIYQNRRVNDTIEADVVMGPIANDTIYETFGIISSGYLRTDEALSLLMLGPEYIQVALKTEKAASQLTWLKADQITAESEKNMKELLKKEQEAFQQEFAEKMQRFV